MDPDRHQKFGRNRTRHLGLVRPTRDRQTTTDYAVADPPDQPGPIASPASWAPFIDASGSGMPQVQVHHDIYFDDKRYRAQFGTST